MLDHKIFSIWVVVTYFHPSSRLICRVRPKFPRMTHLIKPLLSNGTVERMWSHVSRIYLYQVRKASKYFLAFTALVLFCDLFSKLFYKKEKRENIRFKSIIFSLFFFSDEEPAGKTSIFQHGDKTSFVPSNDSNFISKIEQHTSIPCNGKSATHGARKLLLVISFSTACIYCFLFKYYHVYRPCKLFPVLLIFHGFCLLLVDLLLWGIFL